MRVPGRPALTTTLLATAGLLTLAPVDPSLAEAPSPPAHLVVIVMENESSSKIIGNPDTPYLNGFATLGVRFTNYREGNATGGSLPDYLQLAAGSSCGKTTNTVTAGDSTVSDAGCTTTVWNQLQTQSKTWGVYMDAMPAPCSSATGYRSAALDTYYVLKHNPATPFPSV